MAGRCRLIPDYPQVDRAWFQRSTPDYEKMFQTLVSILTHASTPWLLEVNTSPAMGCDCELDEKVKMPVGWWYGSCVGHVIHFICLSYIVNRCSPHVIQHTVFNSPTTLPRHLSH